MAKLQVGIVTDPIYQHHLTGVGHPESPARYLTIEKALKDAHLLTAAHTWQSRRAKDEEILLCHSSAYLTIVKDTIQSIQTSHLPDDGSLCLPTGDTPICSRSMEVARYAVGAG